MSDGWCTIESDPGVFTELLTNVGVKDVEMDEIWDIDVFVDKMKATPKDVYGLIFLFKWKKDDDNSRAVIQDAPGVFFAKQVINNACGTQAIINILMNRPDVDLGPELTQFKSFVESFPPDMKGMAIGNSDSLRTSHNSFARAEPFLQEASKEATEDDDVFHFVGYVQAQGQLWELDGLQPGPIVLGDATPDNWLIKAKEHISARIRTYSATESSFNLLAIVKRRQTIIEQELVKLKGQSGKENEISILEEELQQEKEKHVNWKNDNIRRRHNYLPFVYNMFKILAKKQQLQPLKEAAKKRIVERQENEKKRKAEADLKKK